MENNYNLLIYSSLLHNQIVLSHSPSIFSSLGQITQICPSHWFKVKEVRCRSNVRKKIFTMRLVRYWNWLPKKNCGCPNPRTAQGQTGCGFEQLGLVEGVPVHGRVTSHHYHCCPLDYFQLDHIFLEMQCQNLKMCVIPYSTSQLEWRANDRGKVLHSLIQTVF